jgi:hypothetical protein
MSSSASRRLTRFPHSSISTFNSVKEILLLLITIETSRLAAYYLEPSAENSAMLSILHGENSTVKAEWHPNPTTRGTWNIYQTCIVGKWMYRFVYVRLPLMGW